MSKALEAIKLYESTPDEVYDNARGTDDFAHCRQCNKDINKEEFLSGIFSDEIVLHPNPAAGKWDMTHKVCLETARKRVFEGFLNGFNW